MKRLHGWLSLHQAILLFIASSATFIGVAWWRAYVVGVAQGDALSRSYSAMMVLHSRFPHLAALGFVWPPLPALAQVPLLLVRGASYYAFSGGVVTALSAALMLVGLNSLMRWAQMRFGWRAVLLGLFALNPMWLFYATNGMSEMPFMAFFTLAMIYYLRWHDNGQWPELVFASGSTVGMFLCRYDAALFAGAFVMVMLLVIVSHQRPINPPRVEANLLTYLTPVTYFGALWVFFNWQIMGDPLFWLSGEYSNAFLTRSLATSITITNLQNSWLLTFRFLFLNIMALSPLFLCMLPLAVAQAIRRRDVALIGLIVLALVIPLFQLISYRNGGTFGFVRFFFTVQPSALVMGLAIWRVWDARGRAVLMALMVVGLGAGIALSWLAMQVAAPGQAFAETIHEGLNTEAGFANALLDPTLSVDTFAGDRSVAAALRQRFEKQPALILVDSQAEEVVLFTALPERFIVPSDDDYHRAVAEPAARADYVLMAPAAYKAGEFHVLHDRYPNFYERGDARFVLDSQIGIFRLYRSLLRRAP
ncbi:MAG: glycosyltransferase family 39 protein [Acidobacteria bacterium]|nr:glycosyltransferase family 39 protein [Acidobacteriota bacterium]